MGMKLNFKFENWEKFYKGFPCKFFFHVNPMKMNPDQNYKEFLYFFLLEVPDQFMREFLVKI